jgi:hypothetical protein
MKNKTATPPLKSWPRLSVEPNDSGPKNETGYLQLNSTGEKIKVGDTMGREFRLLQCLFSAQNFITAKYAPVTQTYERLYSAIKVSGDLVNAKLTDIKSANGEMMHIVQSVVRTLQKGAAGKYLVFVTVDDKLRMEIAGAVAA